MRASVQSRATQLVMSRGSRDRNIPKDMNVGHYGLFTFVVKGREMQVLEPKRQKHCQSSSLAVTWTSVRCNQSVKAKGQHHVSSRTMQSLTSCQKSKYKFS